METWKRIGKRLLHPPGWCVFVLTLASATALVCVFAMQLQEYVLAYGVYGISFYALTLNCLIAWKKLPQHYKKIKGQLYTNTYTKRYFTDDTYKAHMKLYSSLFINVLYVIINAGSAVLYRTHWFAIFSVYYGLIAMMRFLLARYMRKNGIGTKQLAELKRARTCAGILLTINFSLSSVVLMMVYFNRGFSYQGYFIYVMAAYTFYITVIAIRDVIKYRKYKSPVLAVTKIVQLTSALFSMLFLETAMFLQFGAETPVQTRQIMIMATGAGISVLVIWMAVTVIVRTSREIRTYKNETEETTL